MTTPIYLYGSGAQLLAQVRQYHVDDVLLFDAGDDLDGGAAMGAGFNIALKDRLYVYRGRSEPWAEDLQWVGSCP